jgi:hypothetical protein
MRGAPGLQGDLSSAKVERRRRLDGDAWADDNHAVESVAHRRAKRFQIKSAPRRQGARKILVTDENDALADKRAIAEDVVRMGVGVNHIANRLGCRLLQRSNKRPCFDQAAAGVDHGHGVITDNRSKICDISIIFVVHKRGPARMGEYAGRDFLELELRRGGWAYVIKRQD